MSNYPPSEADLFAAKARDFGRLLRLHDAEVRRQTLAEHVCQHNAPSSEPAAQTRGEGGAVDTSMEAEPHADSTAVGASLGSIYPAGKAGE